MNGKERSSVPASANIGIPEAQYKKELQKHSSLVFPVILTSFLILMCNSVFELLKQVIFSNVSTWESNLVTIFINTIGVTILSYFILRQRQMMIRQSIKGIYERRRSERTLRKNELKYWTLIQNVNEYIYSVNYKDGKPVTTYHSPKCLDITGYSHYEYYEDSNLWIRMVHKDDRELVLRYFREILNNLNPQPIEHRIVHKDGSIRWITNNSSVQLDEAGKIVRLNGFIFDITERKRVEMELLEYRNHLEELVGERTFQLENANEKLRQEIVERKQIEKALRESEERFRTIVETAPSLLHISDESGNTTYVSPNCEEITGYRPEDLLGKFVWMVHDDDLSWVKELMGQAFNDKREVRNCEYKAVKKNSEIWYASTSCKPMIGADGEHKGMMLQTHDITMHKEAEKKIKKLNEELKNYVVRLESVNEELEAFNYSVSHDMRSPLVTIGGFTRMILKRYGVKLDEEGRHFLDVVIKDAEKMEELIDDLLSLSRIGFAEIKLADVEMNKLVKTVVEELQENASERTVNFKIKPLPEAYGDSIMLEQVLVNLISNALKYTSKKPITNIEIGSKSDGIENIYYVKDNGVGFNMKYSDKLFKAFQRIHNKENFPGTGVGLAIVQRIIRKHGGRVWAAAKVNKGATFYFSLPIKNSLEKQSDTAIGA